LQLRYNFPGLQKHKNIQGFIAGALLLLFTLSIMPKLYLHDLFATHQDLIINTGQTEPGIIKDGYSCDVNDLVATSPFTETENVIVFNPEIDYPVLHTRYTSQIAAAAPACFTLRGPPVLA
jgi:hypothetical protein